MLYHPEVPTNSRMFVASPNSINLPFESIYLRSLDNTKLHSYLLLQPQPQLCPTVLFFHGNAGNIGHRLPNAKGLYKHLQANVFLVEYRGYGLSEGVPSESGIYKDAQGALNYLHTRQDIDRRRIIIFGRSLGIFQIALIQPASFNFLFRFEGGAVAVDLAFRQSSPEHIYCLLLENSFTSIPDMAKQIIPWKGLSYLPLWFHKNKVPIDLIHPPHHTKEPTLKNRCINLRNFPNKPKWRIPKSIQ